VILLQEKIFIQKQPVRRTFHLPERRKMEACAFA
jgi:hypothetical protein